MALNCWFASCPESRFMNWLGNIITVIKKLSLIMDSARKLGGESIDSWQFNSPFSSQVVRLTYMMRRAVLS